MAEGAISPSASWYEAGTDAERTRALFEAAAALQGEPRRRLLDAARSLAPTVASEVESLLEFHSHESAILDRALPDAAARLTTVLDEPRPHPKQIGRYTITRELGHGGMGVVYEATQDFPKRTVALKVIRPELVGPSLLRRFEHEAEALASVQHPAIAQLFEAGHDAAILQDGSHGGRVAFIAMELVTGRPLTEAARELPLRERIGLAARVCEAVEHAHRRGVIHRDLKPGNILVDESGQPKVLDFGIAKLADQTRHGTIETHAGQIVGTVGYMSPEQLAGDVRALDLRCDVYALGVLLYECLAGRPPFNLKGLSVVQAAAAVREREPTPLGRHAPQFRGDLEAIAAKALEKTPERRYSSAGELAQDLRRHLNHEPVSARPLTALYHAGKFAARHRGLVASLATVMLALAGGAAGFAWQARIARTEAAEADRTRAFLSQLLEYATPEVAQGRTLSMRDGIDRAEKSLESADDMSPKARASLHDMLGRIYVSLYEHQKALHHYDACAAYMEEKYGPESREAIHARMLTIWPLTAVGRTKEAWALTNRLLPIARARLGEADEDTVDLYSSLAVCACEEVGLSKEEVLRHQRTSCEKTAAHYGHDSVEADRERMNYGVTLMRDGEIDASLPILAECLRWRRATLGEAHPSVLVALNNYGAALSKAQRLPEAITIFEQSLASAERVHGLSAKPTAYRRRDLADGYAQAGRFSEAEKLMRRQCELLIPTLGPTEDTVRDSRGLLIGAIIAQGKTAEARRELDRFFADVKRDLGERHPATIKAATLYFDLCEAEKDAEGMKLWADFFKGTEFEQAAKQQAEDAQRKFGKPAQELPPPVKER